MATWTAMPTYARCGSVPKLGGNGAIISTSNSCTASKPSLTATPKTMPYGATLDEEVFGQKELNRLLPLNLACDTIALVV